MVLAMLEWTEYEIERLRRRYVGTEDDFAKLLRYLSVAWTRADLKKFEQSGSMLAWDDYFRREKLLRSTERRNE